MMESIGQKNISLKTIMDEVLSVPPVFVTKEANLEFETISSSVMKNDENPVFETTVWRQPD